MGNETELKPNIAGSIHGPPPVRTFSVLVTGESDDPAAVRSAIEDTLFRHGLNHPFLVTRVKSAINPPAEVALGAVEKLDKLREMVNRHTLHRHNNIHDLALKVGRRLDALREELEGKF